MLTLLFKNTSFFDLIIILQALSTLHNFPFFAEVGIFGCRVIIISIEGNDGSTVCVTLLTYRWLTLS